MSVRTLTSQITCKRSLAAGGLILVLGFAVTGCKMDPIVVSSGGKSATVAPEDPASAARSASPSGPASSAVPSTPAPVVTDTGTPAPVPSVTESASTTAVSTCLPPAPTADYLRALATAPQARADLATCLQVPDAPGFEDQVALYAFEALQSGEFATGAGRQEWTRADGDVRCPDGRVVRSIREIYSQYS